MKSRMIMVERLDLVSSKSFEQVLLELDKGIGRPIANYFEQKAAAKSFEEYERLVNGSVGTSDLVEFLRLDPGAVFRKDPTAKAFKMVRIIAGNPLIMKRMAERVSDAATAILNPVLLLRRTELVLSLVGLASTVSFAIAQRTNEIGIRMALGAQRANVVWIVIRVTLATVASGIAGGLVLNLTLGRVLRHWMPGSVIAPWMLLE